MATGAELSYNISNTTASAMAMANTIFGSGVTVSSASFTGDRNSIGIFSNGDALSPEATPSNTGVIISTGRIVDFTQSSGDPNRAAGTSTNTAGIDNNAQFNAEAGTNTFDATWLDATFTPTGNVMTINFVFASEEYPEFSSSVYNDMFVIWINGQAVDLSVGSSSVSTVSNVNNTNLYISNTADTYNTEMDGFTVTLSATIPVNAGVANTIRLGIADVSDTSYDSAVLIAADSIQSTLVAQDDYLKMVPNQTKTFDILGNDLSTTSGTLTITAINGVPISVGQTVTLPSGETVTLNADGTITVVNDADNDEVSLTYTVTNSSGGSDSAFITIACFVAGTMIATPQGLRAIETLSVDDLVLTEDEGAQPLRWIGEATVPALGPLAPIRFAANALGQHGELCLSPQHRVLMRDPLAELLFGAGEVLVAAKDLVNGTTITQAEGGMVRYFHLLFDRHQVIRAEGLAAESFLPAPALIGGMEAPQRAKILALFPHIAEGKEAFDAARPLLRSFEARLIPPHSKREIAA